MAKPFANSGDPDEMLQNACTVCHLPFWGSPDLNGLKDWIVPRVGLT